MTSRSRVAASAVTVLAVLSLAGCAGFAQPRITRLPTDGPAGGASSQAPAPGPTTSAAPAASPAPSAPPASGEVDCGGVAISVTSTGTQLVGDCPDVTIQGSALAVDATRASLVRVAVRGDRVTLTAESVSELTVQGNDVRVDARSLSSVAVEGDRNTVTATGGIDAVTLRGNDNTVRAQVDRVDDGGARNTVG
ncbi:DUF3060 domain-containing protein [Microbacterium sp. 10M-3C3]|jgi:hypothetical protein|uniref:DUF3060 domain-containing protein n=1 Tax=Microbacterium sp. 10M-3C3 TaxID=2483401 RepID=UPI000F62E469|nr:DUF3060 domain-containing protein [Microbacterium sp. 10M-3C3]